MQLAPAIGRKLPPLCGQASICHSSSVARRHAALIQVRNGEIARVGTENIPPEGDRAFLRPGERDSATFACMFAEICGSGQNSRRYRRLRGINRYARENSSPFSLAASRSRASSHATTTLPVAIDCHRIKTMAGDAAIVIQRNGWGKGLGLSRSNAKNEHCRHISGAGTAPRSEARCHRAQPQSSAGSRHQPICFLARA